ncbi:MAG TPA: enediyne biosynthesis protein [Micromonosporaceae bacterium]|nr:enediyne biosynthesis protein [Micromonosporaceae bacterium]
MSDKPARDPRLIALRNFAISISVLNIFGYTVLGFEQPWLWPFFALAAGYSAELVLEVIGARSEGRAPRFVGRGFRGLVEFLYPAHITSLAVNMLIYVNDRVWTMIFGVLIAISGKWLLRVPVNGRMRHFMNPSNFGLGMLLLLFPWVSIAPPYQFTAHVEGVIDWIIPLVIIIFGTMINAMLIKRMWLIAGWLSVFVLQAVVRGILMDVAISSALAIMTGVAFVLFTNYMITDPGTTPFNPVSQFAFGGGAALAYGVLTGLGIAYGLFFATMIVCGVRGCFLWTLHLMRQAQQRRESAEQADRSSSGSQPPAAPITKEFVRA